MFSSDGWFIRNPLAGKLVGRGSLYACILMARQLLHSGREAVLVIARCGRTLAANTCAGIGALLDTPVQDDRAAGVAEHVDRIVDDLLAVGIQRHNVGCAEAFAEHESMPAIDHAD